jgi:hypothetical protein
LSRNTFVGEAETFRIGPSSMTLLGKRVTIGRDALTISVLDDERAKTEVQRFKGMVERNLQTLHAEYERNKPQLEQTIQQAAAQRKAQIDGLQVRDALKRDGPMAWRHTIRKVLERPVSRVEKVGTATSPISHRLHLIAPPKGSLCTGRIFPVTVRASGTQLRPRLCGKRESRCGPICVASQRRH